MRIGDKWADLASHAENTGSIPVGTTIDKIDYADKIC